MKADSRDKTSRGNASQFFVAGELCRRGLTAVVTLGNCPNTDIRNLLCSRLLSEMTGLGLEPRTYGLKGHELAPASASERQFMRVFEV